MNLPFPTLQILFAIAFAGEAWLIRGRLSGDTSRQADRGSLRMLFGIIGASVGLAWFVGRTVAQARFDVLFGLGLAAMRSLLGTGLALYAAGLALRWYSVTYLGRLFTYDVAIAADHRVVDTGPYRLIRHPSYTGSLLTFVGLGVCGANALALLVLVSPIVLAFLHRIGIEEAALASVLGRRYDDYVGRTKRLIPFVY